MAHFHTDGQVCSVCNPQVLIDQATIYESSCRADYFKAKAEFLRKRIEMMTIHPKAADSKGSISRTAICVRCGETNDPDLRTLWMSCLYDMSELKVPFEKKADGEGRSKNYYTLLVCKDCRADWLMAIENWFGNPRV